MTMPATRWFEDVRAGEALPALEFPATLTALVIYAGATWDFHRYHYDPDFVAGSGMKAPFMDGQMAGALIARLLMQWGGPDAFLRRLSFRLRGMVFAGETIILRGAVSGTAIEDGRGLVLCTLDIVKADGTEVLREAQAALELPRRAG